MNLSTDGFMAVTDLVLETGTTVWLKLPGLEPQNSRVVWAEDGKAGFQFATPLHPATLEMVVETEPQAAPPSAISARRAEAWRRQPKRRARRVVPLEGLEPTTPSLRMMCSTS